MQENRDRPSTTWIVGCISAAGVIIAAIIGLGAPFAERLANVYFPTFTPVASSSPPILPTAAQQILQSPSVAEHTVASPTLTTQVLSNCPFRELTDEINVGNNTGACATMSLAQFLKIMNRGSLQSAIDGLDDAFEADNRIGYQYRQIIPARIPPAPGRQRVLWGSLDWIDKLSPSERDNTNSRIFRLWCNYTNPCIYVILDSDEFYVGFPGRGLIVEEPLSDNTLNQLRK